MGLGSEQSFNFMADPVYCNEIFLLLHTLNRFFDPSPLVSRICR
jgi:hypothetical protein